MKIQPKWNPDKKVYEDSGLFVIYIYETTANGDPVEIGKRKGKDSKEYPQYKIKAAYTVPISTLTKVVEHKAYRAIVYSKPPKPQQGY